MSKMTGNQKYLLLFFAICMSFAAAVTIGEKWVREHARCGP